MIIAVSYVSIVIKVRCGAQPHHHGAASRERKLTMTLFIVTVVSLLTWLPFVIISFLYFTTDIFSSVSRIAFDRLNLVLIIFYCANSLVNPILYAARMPDFRRALVALFRRQPQQLNQAQVIPLRDMWSNIGKKGAFIPLLIKTQWAVIKYILGFEQSLSHALAMLNLNKFSLYKAFGYNIEGSLTQLANVSRLIKLDLISVFSCFYVHFSH